MTSSVKHLASALLALLCGLALPVAAMTLGDLTGSAVLGRALDVSVEIRPSAAEVVSTNCIQAEVYFADERQFKTKVSLQTASSDKSAALRVQLASPVSEPVVTIWLKSSCAGNIQRRYVLLADLPELELLFSADKTASQSAAMIVLPPALGHASGASSPIEPVGKIRATVNQKSIYRRPHVRSDKPATKTARRSSALGSGKARLKLDPLDMLSDRIDALDSVMRFEPPADALRQAQEIAKLQDAVQTLTRLSARQDAKVVDLKMQLQLAKADKTPYWLLYSLSGLVLACLIGLGLLWQRQRRNSPADPAWWQDSAPSSSARAPRAAQRAEQAGATAVVAAKPVFASSPERAATLKPEATAPIPKRPSADQSNEKPVDLNQLFSTDRSNPAVNATHPKVKSPQFGKHRMDNAALQELRQEADFFASLGQNERAVRLFEDYIASAADVSPLIYLDLAELYRALDMREQFDVLQVTIEQLFNVEKLDFSTSERGGKDLEAYPELLEKLSLDWPHARSLKLLQTCIFHNSDLRHPLRYDAPAFRDLLLLHSLAQELANVQSGATPANARDLAATESTKITEPLAPDLLYPGAPQGGATSLAQDLSFKSSQEPGASATPRPTEQNQRTVAMEQNSSVAPSAVLPAELGSPTVQPPASRKAKPLADS